MPQPEDIDWLKQIQKMFTYTLKVRGWKKIFHANGNQNKAGVTILISDKIDFKMKTIAGTRKVTT